MNSTVKSVSDVPNTECNVLLVKEFKGVLLIKDESPGSIMMNSEEASPFSVRPPH